MSPIFKAVCIETTRNSYHPDGVLKGNIYNVSTLGETYDLEDDRVYYYVINDMGKVCGVFNRKYFKTLPEWREHCIDVILEEHE